MAGDAKHGQPRQPPCEEALPAMAAVAEDAIDITVLDAIGSVPVRHADELDGRAPRVQFLRQGSLLWQGRHKLPPLHCMARTENPGMKELESARAVVFFAAEAFEAALEVFFDADCKNLVNH